MRYTRRVAILVCLAVAVACMQGVAVALETSDVPVRRVSDFGKDAVSRVSAGMVPGTVTGTIQPTAANIPLGIIGDYSFDSIYTMDMVGLLYNDSAYSVEWIDLRLTYYNSAGNAIRTDVWNGTPTTMTWVLEPDTIAPFSFDPSGYGGPPPGTVGWELIAKGAKCAKYAIWPAVETLAVEPQGSRDARIAGTVTNDSPYTLTGMRVWVVISHADTGVIYDTAEVIVWGTFAPGQSAGWEMWTTERPADPADMDVLVGAEGNKPPVTTPASRISGRDRFQTALLASGASFADGAGGTVVLASGMQYADALSASALAGALDAPILLSKADSLPWATEFAEELTRLGCTRVVIVGGTSVVTPAVEAQLLAVLPAGAEVDRIAGTDRYGTCAAVLAEIDAVTAASPPTAAFVVRGDAFADALAVSPYAWSQQMPVVLVKPTSAPSNVVSALNGIGVTNLWVVGGTAAVSNKTASSFGLPVQRIAGDNRYETAVEVLIAARDQAWSDMGVLGLTSGAAFPDALVAGPSLGSRNGGLLLTQANSLPFETASGIYTVAEDVNELLVIGGILAVNDWTYKQAHYLCR